MIDQPDRPEWVTCIQGDERWKSVCGRNGGGFQFVNREHADREVAREGRLVPCDACMKKTEPVAAP